MRLIEDIKRYELRINQTISKIKIAVNGGYSNGCGTKSTWFVPDTILGLPITSACDLHDIDCTLSKSMEELQKASNDFYFNIKQIIKTGSIWVYPYRLGVAKVYVESVNYFWLENYAKEREFI